MTAPVTEDPLSEITGGIACQTRGAGEETQKVEILPQKLIINPTGFSCLEIESIGPTRGADIWPERQRGVIEDGCQRHALIGEGIRSTTVR